MLIAAVLVLAGIIEHDAMKTWEARKVDRGCELIADLGDLKVYADKMGGYFTVGSW
jgi:hypothetical protein